MAGMFCMINTNTIQHVGKRRTPSRSPSRTRRRARGQAQEEARIEAVVARLLSSTFLQDEAVTAAPKRFRADITRGSLCLGGDVDEGGVCAPLPIQGVGLFDGLYLDERLRIGQNLNGGGARIVQVRVR